VLGGGSKGGERKRFIEKLSVEDLKSETQKKGEEEKGRRVSPSTERLRAKNTEGERKTQPTATICPHLGK